MNKSAIVLTFLLCGTVVAQTVSGVSGSEVPPSILEIDIENIVFYVRDTTDIAKLASDPNRTTGVQARNFGPGLEGIGDIVAINGTPAKGTFTVQTSGIFYRPDPNQSPGPMAFGIADTMATGRVLYAMEIVHQNGNPIGTIWALGLNNSPPPPGAPPNTNSGDMVVLGGTGAFLGVRGQMAFGRHPAPATAPRPAASMTEDPAFRRVNGEALKFRRIAELFPMAAPHIVVTGGRPVILHGSDFTTVTEMSPARPGEILVIAARNLGPTRPGVAPGQRFPSSSYQPVNSPVEVSVDGRTTAAVNAIGWPDTVGTYRVDFRLPENTAAGVATIHLRAAWLNGPAVQIPVR